MILEIQQQQKEKLEATGKISYKEICEIIDAFQIASGQNFAVGKTKALLEYIKSGKSFIIENFEYSGNNTVILSIKDLANIFKNIDQYIDLYTDKDFKSYFD